MSDNDYKKEIEFILSVVKNGLSTPFKRYDSISGKIIERGFSYEDLGDYLPYLLLFNSDNFANKEIERTISYLEKENYIYHKKAKPPFGLFSRCYDQTDLIFGLILTSQKDKYYTKYAKNALMVWKFYFYDKKPSMAVMNKIPFINLNFPKPIMPKIQILSSEDHGMFIELFCLMYELEKDKRYLEFAKRIYSDFKKTEEYKKYGFFPFYSSNSLLSKNILKYYKSFSKRDSEFQLIKQNSNLLFGVFKLLELMDDKKGKKRLEDEIEMILKTWIKDYFDNEKNVFYTNFNHLNSRKGADLTCFHIIELLIAAYTRFKENFYLEYAKQIADSFIKYQSPITGLLPFLHPETNQDIKRFGMDRNCSWLDSEVDFCVAILRLHQVTKEKKYLNSSKKIIDGIIKFHKQEYGYCSAVNIDTGKVVSSEYSIKMTALVLKIFIAIQNLNKINNKNDFFYWALQDR